MSARTIVALACAIGAMSVPALVLDAQQQVQPEDPANFGSKTVRGVLLEIRLAEGEPVRGLTIEAPVKNSDKKIYVHYAIVATNGDLLRSRVVETAGRYEIGLTLSPPGADKMTEATARHVGRPLALILDGEIVAVQTVRQALGSELIFSGGFTQADATRIVAGLNKWLPELPPRR